MPARWAGQDAETAPRQEQEGQAGDHRAGHDRGPDAAERALHAVGIDAAGDVGDHEEQPIEHQDPGRPGRRQAGGFEQPWQEDDVGRPAGDEQGLHDRDDDRGAGRHSGT
jgi:hypothetical protein